MKAPKLSSPPVPWGEGTKISFEDDLGLDEDEEVVRVHGYYRFKPRHRIEFSYFELSRDGTATALRDLQIEDTIFPVGSRIRGDAQIEVENLRSAFQ